MALAIYWVWLMPSLVDQRILSQIKFGMSGAQVAKAFDINGPFDIEAGTPCSPMSKDKFSRVSIYNVGSVPLLPVPMVYVTTTTFCFDNQDKLVAFRTERSFDGP